MYQIVYDQGNKLNSFITLVRQTVSLTRLQDTSQLFYHRNLNFLQLFRTDTLNIYMIHISVITFGGRQPRDALTVTNMYI